MVLDMPNDKRRTDTSSVRRGESGRRIERTPITYSSGVPSVASISLRSGDTTDVEDGRYDNSGQDVLNAVDDLGMDDTGTQSIDSALSSAGDDTLVVFPPGTYRVSQRQALGYVSNVGLLGDSELIVGSDDCSIENESIDSPGRLTIFSTAQVTTASDTRNDSCLVPAYDEVGSETEPVDEVSDDVDEDALPSSGDLAGHPVKRNVSTDFEDNDG